MITETLRDDNIKNYEIYLIPDIHNPPRWVDHVKSIVSDFDVVIANNALTKKLFTEKGYKTEETPIYSRDKYQGEKIRLKILNDQPWAHLVPSRVAQIIRDVDGIKRIKKIYGKQKKD